jgi:hypothetical protein
MFYTFFLKISLKILPLLITSSTCLSRNFNFVISDETFISNYTSFMSAYLHIIRKDSIFGISCHLLLGGHAL